MHITLILCASTASVHFKFGFDFFSILYVWVFFIIFWFFFKVNSGVFLHNRVASLVFTCPGGSFLNSGLYKKPGSDSESNETWFW